jgi:phospholipase/lecithinase/hemolysin
VTSEIAKGVMRLRKMGMTKVLVNNLQPIGCLPWVTRHVKYTKCDAKGNMAADLHNNQLKNKLADVARSVYVIDLNKAFSSIVNPSDPSKSK